MNSLTGPTGTGSWPRSIWHHLAMPPAAGLPFGTLKRLELASALADEAHDCCCSTSRQPASLTARSTN